MAEISFTCKGHPNILAAQRNTFEFTKDTELSEKGDCIVAVACDFDPKALAEFAKTHKNFEVDISSGSFNETVYAQCNPDFNDLREVVIRLSTFGSPRTFGVFASKAAKNFDRKFIDSLKSENAMINVTIKGK